VNQCRFAEEIADDAYYKAKPRESQKWLSFFNRPLSHAAGEIYIIPHSQHFVNRQFEQKLKNIFSQFCAF
jgi:hypothetical protein